MKIALIAAASLGLLATQPAVAEPALNMVGTWVGTATAVIIGSNPYRVAPGTGPQMPEAGIEFTYKITQQQGNRFSGTSSAGNFSETIIGALNSDNTGGVMLDDDGQYQLVIKDPNTIDVCYSHSFPTSRVVSCWVLKRTP
jgi:hypothetical protein